MNAHLTYILAQQRSVELRRSAERARLERDAGIRRNSFRRVPPGAEQSARAERVTLRFGSAADEDTLARLAALDSAELPAYPVLLAEVDGRLLAALGLSDGTAIADPFHRTADLIDLLRARAHHLDGTGGMRRSGRLPSWSRVRALAGR
ncbi:MAG: hypothetical protein ACRDNK_05590 [Solirubrobacteraceae bacterium]